MNLAAGCVVSKRGHARAVQNKFATADRLLTRRTEDTEKDFEGAYDFDAAFPS